MQECLKRGSAKGIYTAIEQSLLARFYAKGLIIKQQILSSTINRNQIRYRRYGRQNICLENTEHSTYNNRDSRRYNLQAFRILQSEDFIKTIVLTA